MDRDALLWLDIDPKKSLQEKITAAAAEYEQKRGHKPNLCFVSTKELEQPIEVNGICVEPKRFVLKHHFQIGVSNGHIGA